MHPVPQKKSLPQDVLLNPEIDWHVSGVFSKDLIIRDFINIITNEFDNPNPIKAVTGSPNYLWNSDSCAVYCGKKDIDANLSIYEHFRIPVFASFGNSHITEKDLDDVSSNYFLERIAQKRGNGVVVTSDILSDYIRKKFPDLKQMASFPKVAQQTEGRDKAFYESLAGRFDRVIIHPNDNFDLDLLSSLYNKNRFEIIVNSNCIVDCPYYAKCAEPANNFLEFDERSKFFKEHCIPCPQQLNIKKGKENAKRLRNTNLTNDEVSALNRLGFRYFHLSNRTNSPFLYINDLTRYTLEPSFTAPLVFKLLIGT